MDLRVPRIVQPNKTNDRIVRQDGAFILTGLSSNDLSEQLKLNIMTQAELIVTNKSKMLSELDRIGINEASLFPGIDNVAHYLKERRV